MLDITPRGWEILRTNMVEDEATPHAAAKKAEIEQRGAGSRATGHLVQQFQGAAPPRDALASTRARPA